MSYGGFIGLFLASTLLIAVPGPTVLYLVGQTFGSGRKTALCGVAGNAAGMATVAGVVSIGLGAVLLDNPSASHWIRGVGAFALFAIGLSYLKRGNLHRVPDRRTEQPKHADLKRAIGSGYLVGVSNPKALVMFGTVVPSFLSKGSLSPVASLFALSGVPIALGLFIDSLWVALAYRLRVVLNRSSGHIRMIRVSGGILMIVLGFMIIIFGV